MAEDWVQIDYSGWTKPIVVEIKRREGLNDQGAFHAVRHDADAAFDFIAKIISAGNDPLGEHALPNAGGRIRVKLK